MAVATAKKALAPSLNIGISIAAPISPNKRRFFDTALVNTSVETVRLPNPSKASIFALLDATIIALAMAGTC